jgi:hypothetical protein
MTCRLRRWALALAVLALTGCRRAPPAEVVPVTAPRPAPLPAAPPLSRWPTTLADALRAVDAGRFDEADRLLAAASAEFPGSPESREAEFWRIVFRVDPRNPLTTTTQARAMLDAYLASSPPSARYAEAQVLRRLVITVDSTRGVVDSLRGAGEARQRARDEEIKKLSEDLDRTMAELERIKRRLAPVKPPGSP